MKKIVIVILGFVMFFVGCADKNTDIQSSTTKENIEKVFFLKKNGKYIVIKSMALQKCWLLIRKMNFL